MQTHAGRLTHVTGDPGDGEELSPEVQIGRSPGLQVMVHFGHGGGPTALHEAGWFRLHAGVALDDGPLGIGIGFSCAIVAMGESKTARRNMRAAIIFAFLNSCAPAIT